MPPRTEALYDKALSLAGNVEDNFLDLGRSLRQLLDRDQKIIEKTDLGRRKAYYLVEVSRTFDPLPITRARLRKLGWTKLQIIGKYAAPDNVEELVSLAEQSSAKQLERLMRGEQSLKNARCVLMYFSSKQYAKFEHALLLNGASKSGRGLINKEGALIKALRKAAPGPEAPEPWPLDPVKPQAEEGDE